MPIHIANAQGLFPGVLVVSRRGGRIFRGVKVICVKRIICGRDDFFCSSASTETELEALEVG